MAVSPHHIVVDTLGPDEFASTGICFMPVGDRKTVKNRLHFDLAPDDQEAEVEQRVLRTAPKASLIAYRDASA